MKRVLPVVLLVAGCTLDPGSDPPPASSATVSLDVTPNDVGPPGACAYSVNPATYSVNQAIQTNVLNCYSGAPVTSAIVDPPGLPRGLSIDSAGNISGTPTATANQYSYNVYVSNAYGSGGVVAVTITVQGVLPPAQPCSYVVNPAIYTRGQAIQPNALRCDGGAITSAAIGPGLPAGLSISTAGTISGTPTAISNSANYTVTASNSAGSTDAALNITVVSGADAGVNYIFVTSVAVAPGALGGVAAADAVCRNLAADAGLPGGFVALLPSSTYSARERIGSARAWYRPDGRPSLDTVDGHVFYVPDLTEHGVPWAGVAFTGLMHSSGTTATETCAFWTTSTGRTVAGDPRQEYSVDWMTAIYKSCDQSLPFYCLGVDQGAPLRITPPTVARRAFVTSGTFRPGAGGIAAADALCISEALSAGLSGTFRAFLSTQTTPAGARFGANGANWYRPDNIALFPNASALLSAGSNTPPLATPSLIADGGESFGYGVWTGSQAPSVAGGKTCADWTANVGYGDCGGPGVPTPSWFYYCNALCSVALHLYCLEVGWKDRIGVNEMLSRGSWLRSLNGRYTLHLQSSDGHLVLYNSAGTAIWATSQLNGNVLALQGDGNLVLYRSDWVPIWASNTSGSGAQIFVVQDDGNMVIYNSAWQAVWYSNTAGL